MSPARQAFNSELNPFAPVEPSAALVLGSLGRTRRSLQAGETLVHEGCRSPVVFLILSGIAFRYKLLPNGRRQIFGYLLPGDLCDAEFTLDSYCDHSVELLTDVEVALISISELQTVILDRPMIARALKQTAAVEAAILREWLLNLGQRNAFERIAYFFCEMAARLHGSAGLSTKESLPFPFTQIELADTVGLTVVHVNRCLQRFRREKLIAWHRRRVAILDVDRLQQIAGFDGSYLKLGDVITMPECRVCA
jgi:CRP-like cAMP-binding protein